MKAEQGGRNGRAISLIAESVSKTLYQAEALSQQIENLKANASRLQKSLDQAVRRRDAGGNFDVANVAQLNTVPNPVPHTHTVA